MIPSFNIAPTGPEEIARKRAIATALMGRFGKASNVGQGIGDLLLGVGLGVQGRKLDKAEAASRKEADALFSSIFGGGTPASAPAAPEMAGNAYAATSGGTTDPATARVAQAHGGSPYRDAIAKIESAGSGDYAAVGPTHPSMGRALGRYQIMEANIGPWSKAALGREVTADEFLNNPALQDAIFDFQFGNYVNQYGPEGAAQAWFAGPGGVGKTGRKDVLGTTVGEYGKRFMENIGGQPVQVAQAGGQPVMSDASPQGNGRVMQLYSALANPYLRPEQKAVVQMMLQQELQRSAPVDPLEKRYREAQIANLESQVAQRNNPDARAKFGLSPQYGVDANGNPVLLQLDDQGNAARTNLPEGVTLSKEPIKLDAGTHFILLNPITQQSVGSIPKDIAGEAAEKEAGKAKGEATFDLPRVEQNAGETLALIEKLRGHPGRGTGTGASSWLDPRNYLAGTDAQNFRIMLDQAKGQTFLQAYQSLKGGGQITEIEGTKAENAIARLNTAQSDEAFMAALDDFEAIIKIGLERARKQAGITGSQSAPDSPGKRLKFNPATGALE